MAVPARVRARASANGCRPAGAVRAANLALVSASLDPGATTMTGLRRQGRLVVPQQPPEVRLLVRPERAWLAEVAPDRIARDAASRTGYRACSRSL